MRARRVRTVGPGTDVAAALRAVGTVGWMTAPWGLPLVGAAVLASVALPAAGALVWLSVVLWSAYVAHEVAHLLVFRRLTRRPEAGAFRSSGPGIRMVAARAAPEVEGKVARAGPLTGLVVVLLAALPWLLTGPGAGWGVLLAGAVLSQAVNLLPGSPDGRISRRSRLT